MEAESLDHWQELSELPSNTSKEEQLKLPALPRAVPPRFVAESKLTVKMDPSPENCALVRRGVGGSPSFARIANELPLGNVTVYSLFEGPEMVALTKYCPAVDMPVSAISLVEAEVTAVVPNCTSEGNNGKVLIATEDNLLATDTMTLMYSLGKPSTDTFIMLGTTSLCLTLLRTKVTVRTLQQRVCIKAPRPPPAPPASCDSVTTADCAPSPDRV